MDVIQLGDALLLYNELEQDWQEQTVSGLDEPEAAAQVSGYDLDYLKRVVDLVAANIATVIKGKDDTIRNVLVALLSDGHVLVEDVPGVGKTMLAQALSKSIRTAFKRIQFTPDMLPTDVTGVSVYDEQAGEFTFMPGPIFANVILADEINRGTPRVQSSLLECMSESVVTVDGRAHVLRKPFFVIATQNPVEFHGTYPLPEAQLDRFLMRLRMGYPDTATERDILGSQVASHPITAISHVVDAGDILRCQALVRTVHVSEPIKDYIVTMAAATRRHPALLYGCSPRASLALMRAGQASAAATGRDYVLPRDVRDLAPSVLGHRLPLKLQARAEFASSEAVVQHILEQLPLERWEKQESRKGR
ncbi:MAG: MoxR family ATPase [Lentisphaeria bacterium]|nr:MoxR family ATPase [Lentisphaeria bacterium]